MITQYRNVVGVGKGFKNRQESGALSHVFLVKKKLPLAALDAQDVIPKSIDGMPTDVIQVGEIRAQGRLDRTRPAPGGSSIGHYKITAGTLGCVVHHPTKGKVILSNNHVLANSNDAQLGDPIYQPGPYDGGRAEDQIGLLDDFQPIDFGTGEATCNLAKMYAAFGNGLARALGSSHRVKAVFEKQAAPNLFDAAIARPLDQSMVTEEILDIGLINGMVSPYLGMKVRKSGRTTGYTHGEVIVLDATVEVSYGEGKTATFDQQIITGPMSQGGDSGSLLVAETSQQAVGLLFAGSDEVTIHSLIQPVLDRFGVSFQ